MDIAVAGSSGFGPVIGVSAEPTALLTALPADAGGHVLLLTPPHLERRSREQAHVVVAAHRDLRVGVLALEHHALTLTMVAASVHALRDTPSGWADAGEAIQLVEQAAARSRSIVWHPRVLGLRQPIPSVGQSALSVLRTSGYFAELGADTGPARGAGGFAVDGEEVLYVAGKLPILLSRQLGEAEVRTVEVVVEGSAPYRTRRSVELCGLAAPAWAPFIQQTCRVCSVSRPASGCLYCGTGADRRALAPAASAAG